MNHICDDYTATVHSILNEIRVWFKFIVCNVSQFVMFLELLPRELQMVHKNDMIQLYEITTAAGFPDNPSPPDTAHS